MSDNSFKSALGLLRDPNVSRLFGAYLVTYTGTAMAPIAMAFGVHGDGVFPGTAQRLDKVHRMAGLKPLL